MSNQSGKPVYDHGFLVTSKSTRGIVKAARKGAMGFGPWFRWPENHFFATKATTHS